MVPPAQKHSLFARLLLRPITPAHLTATYALWPRRASSTPTPPHADANPLVSVCCSWGGSMSDWDTVTYIGKRHTGGTTRHASEADVNRARRTGTEIDTAKKCTRSR